MIDDAEMIIPSSNLNKLLTRNSIVLRFSSFQEARKAHKLFASCKFQDRELKCTFLNGNLRTFDQEYFEVIDTESSE